MYTTNNMEYYPPMRTENNFEMHFDDERPPIYNAEDYADHLRKYSRLNKTIKNTQKNIEKILEEVFKVDGHPIVLEQAAQPEPG